jgi:DNA-directed RNA polymerase subunit RPC12/RpoP
MIHQSYKCISCGAPVHEATAWIFDREKPSIICGACGKEFATWLRCRMAQMNRRKKGQDISFSEAVAKSIIGDPPPYNFKKRIIQVLNNRPASFHDIEMLGHNDYERRLICIILQNLLDLGIIDINNSLKFEAVNKNKKGYIDEDNNF